MFWKFSSGGPPAHNCGPLCPSFAFVSSHWTLLSNFYFLHHPQIPHSLKDIVACTFLHAVHACLHVHTLQHYKSTRETIINKCWKFGEDPTYFPWDKRWSTLTYSVCGCVHVRFPNPSEWILHTPLICVPSFIKIQLQLAEIWGGPMF